MKLSNSPWTAEPSGPHEVKVKPEYVMLNIVLLLASTSAEALNDPDGVVNVIDAL